MGAYLAFQLINDPTLGPVSGNAASVASIMPYLFGVAGVVSSLSFVMACLKSPLPALMALVAILPLYLLGLLWPAQIALIVAAVATIIFAVGYALYGGRLAVSKPVEKT